VTQYILEIGSTGHFSKIFKESDQRLMMNCTRLSKIQNLFYDETVPQLTVQQFKMNTGRKMGGLRGVVRHSKMLNVKYSSSFE
jgi:hypothetical protein